MERNNFNNQSHYPRSEIKSELATRQTTLDNTLTEIDNGKSKRKHIEGVETILFRPRHQFNRRYKIGNESLYKRRAKRHN